MYIYTAIIAFYIIILFYFIFLSPLLLDKLFPLFASSLQCPGKRPPCPAPVQPNHHHHHQNLSITTSSKSKHNQPKINGNQLKPIPNPTEINQNKPPTENPTANPFGKPKSTQNPRCCCHGGLGGVLTAAMREKVLMSEGEERSSMESGGENFQIWVERIFFINEWVMSDHVRNKRERVCVGIWNNDKNYY